MAEAAERVALLDLKPPVADMKAEVLAGLSARQKRISPKYFYDERGSALFEQITELDEYYPTRTEIGILAANRGAIARTVGEDVMLIEYGSGSSAKIRILLESLRPQAYVPVDISRDHLVDAAQQIDDDYGWLAVYPTCADYTRAFELPEQANGQRRLAFFPGSSVGNFEPADAVEFLGEVRSVVGESGQLLIGVDRKKDPAVLERAYDDAQGVTAAFNANVLAHINDTLGADFDLEAFAHEARYDAHLGRVEMHLVSRTNQVVDIDGNRVSFSAGEGIHTENSYKYHADEFDDMARSAGFQPRAHWADENHWFSVMLYEASETPS
jgi:dimethylhistidine N-methyltransferase